MTAVYLDASAFVKAVVTEPQSDALRRYLAGRDRLVSSALTRAEALRAVRAEGADALRSVRQGLRSIDLIAIDEQILDVAGLLDPAVLRTLDAIHVATALAIGDDLDVVVTYDARMIRAAQMVGLETVAPGATAP